MKNILRRALSIVFSLSLIATPSYAVSDPILGDYSPGVNFGLAGEFNLVVLGDHTQSSVDAEGRVAIKGNATLTNYGVGSSSSLLSSPTRGDLFVGGVVDITNGTNFKGNTYVSSTGSVLNYTMTNNNGVPGQPIVSDAFDFSAVEQYLKSVSSFWSSFAPNGTTLVQPWGTLILTGNDPSLNIFYLDAANLSPFTLGSLVGIDIVAPIGSTILINVQGATHEFGSYQMFRNGLTATGFEGQYILWNFYDATTITSQNLSVKGSVLAPYADWLAVGTGNYEGTMMVKSLTDSGGTIEGHSYLFTGQLPVLPTTDQYGDLSVFKFVDDNQNGSFDLGELPLEGISFELFTADDVSLGTQLTDVNGLISFQDLLVGEYYLVESSDHLITTALNLDGNIDVSITADALTSVDVGNYIEPVPQYGDLSVFKFVDDNQNGSFDLGELPLEGISFELFTADDVSLGTQLTDVNGLISFQDLLVGEYYLVESSDHLITTALNLDGNIDVSITADALTSVDVGNYIEPLNPELSIEKVVDFNGDSIFSDYEEYYHGSIATWRIIVSNTGNDPISDIYLHDTNLEVFGPFNLLPGEYQVVEYTDVIEGNVLNGVTASGLDSSGTPVDEVEDVAEVDILYSYETAWAYGGDLAIPFTDLLNRKNTEWGWTNGQISDGDNLIFDIYAGAGNNDLTKGTLVGQLEIEYTLGTLTVVYQMYDDNVMTGAQLYVGEEILQRDHKNKFTASPGLYDHKVEYDSQMYTFEVSGLEGDIYVSAHADVRLIAESD